MKKWSTLVVPVASAAMLFGSVLNVSAAELKDLFDAKYYAETYADLKEAFGENEEALWKHYQTYGIKEGRNMGEGFDVASYRSRYADLEKAFGDDWAAYVKHYVTYGIAEGRDGGGLFDAVSYADRYADLKEAYGYQYGKLYQHYRIFGEKEGRDPVSQSVLDAREAALMEETEDDRVLAGMPDGGIDALTGTFRTDISDGSYFITVLENGRILSETSYDANGQRQFVATNSYNSVGQMIQSIYTDCMGGAPVVRQDYEYNSSGQHVQTTEYHNDEYVYKYVYTYNAQGQQVKVTEYDNTNQLNRETITDYYASGRRKSETSEYQGAPEWVREYYDIESSSLKSETVYDENGTPTVTNYDEAGNVISD